MKDNIARIINCIEQVGAIINEDEILIEDSIQFVTLIVELENEFEISIPDEYLSDDMAFKSLDRLVNILAANMIESD